MELQGKLTGPSNEYQICCIRCNTRENLQMIAHRNGLNFMVGWIFVCPECLPFTVEGGVVVGGPEVTEIAQTLIFLDSLGEMAEGADLRERVRNAVVNYAAQLGRHAA